MCLIYLLWNSYQGTRKNEKKTNAEKNTQTKENIQKKIYKTPHEKTYHMVHV